jgi:hypothetical protein
MDAGTCDDQVTHEPLANVRFAELTGESNSTANHYPSTDIQVFHDGIMDRTCCVVEEDVYSLEACVLDGCREVRILAQLASDDVLDSAYEWLCRRRRDYSANTDV